MSDGYTPWFQRFEFPLSLSVVAAGGHVVYFISQLHGIRLTHRYTIRVPDYVLSTESTLSRRPWN